MFDGHVDYKTRKIEHGKNQENIKNVRLTILTQLESFRFIKNFGGKKMMDMQALKVGNLGMRKFKAMLGCKSDHLDSILVLHQTLLAKSS